MKRVLVLEGGGAKGLSQLNFLTRLEQESGKKINVMFDLIVGTSVGSINGAVLASGISANEFYPMFRKGLTEIFSTKWYNPFGLFGPKYDRKNFDKMWALVFKDRPTGKDLMISDVVTPFMCTALDRVDDTNFYFKSWQDKFKDWALSYCVKASFAAPYYFGQMVDEKYQRVWFDGGTGLANCPIDQAFAECFKLGWLPSEKIQFTVVGCGSAPAKNKASEFKRLKSQGLKGQLSDYMDPADGGMARKQATKDQISRYQNISETYKNLEIRYVNVETTKGSMDDVSEDTLQYLEDAGFRMLMLCKSNGWKW
jgi:predicted acylesterase/phospholipase RssA